MACEAGMLGTLPPELRQCVYSNLFFDDGDRTIQIEQTSRSDDFLSDMLAVSEDDFYVAQRKRGNVRWPKEIDEAFFLGM